MPRFRQLPVTRRASRRAFGPPAVAPHVWRDMAEHIMFGTFSHASIRRRFDQFRERHPETQLPSYSTYVRHARLAEERERGRLDGRRTRRTWK